jgi:hypothetical protein
LLPRPSLHVHRVGQPEGGCTARDVRGQKMVRNQLLNGHPFDDVLVRRVGQMMHANGLRCTCGPDRQDAHARRIDALEAVVGAAFVRRE